MYKWILFILIFASCSQNQNSELDTPTSGKISVAVDVSYQPVIEEAVKVFEFSYPKAKINALYVSESEAVQLLLNDSVRVAIVPRLFQQSEKEYFEKIKIKPRATQIAVDAIALIVHKESSDTAIHLEKVLKILNGEIQTWAELGKNPNRKDSITLVFDHPGSSIVRYVLDTLNKSKGLPPKSYSAKTNDAVIDYVSKNKNAIGLIPMPWIADMEDSTANQFMSKIQVVHIIGSDGEYRKPFLYYLKNREYPFIRDVFALSREARSGLGTGFVSFLAGKEGQRLIYKADLLPVNKPIRLVEMKTKSLSELGQ